MSERALVLAICTLAAALFGAAPCAGQGTMTAGVSPYLGARALDSALDDYRWDVRPARLLGAEAWMSVARFEFALAVERSWTEQSTGLPGAQTSPGVALTGLLLRTRARLSSFGPVNLHAGAGIGRLHLGWDPDRTTHDLDGMSEPLVVNYDPIDTWRSELEVGARIALPGPVDLGLTATWAQFDLETAHRSGTEIVERTETFSTFDARVFLRWSIWGGR